MRNRNRLSHAGKTPSERSAYQRYIRQLESQPTVEEPTEMDPSFEPRQELTQSISTRERSIPFSLRVRDHFEKNWVAWIFTVFLAIATFLLYDAKVNIAVLTHDFSTQQQNLERINTSLDDNTNANHDQDLIIQELRIRMEYLASRLNVLPTELVPISTEAIPTATTDISTPTP